MILDAPLLYSRKMSSASDKQHWIILTPYTVSVLHINLLFINRTGKGILLIFLLYSRKCKF